LKRREEWMKGERGMEGKVDEWMEEGREGQADGLSEGWRKEGRRVMDE
jgi:hypothetical protein